MIRFTDAAQLAYTKLRARKVRLIVTVVISSLLFGLLALSSFVVRGIVSSTNSFEEEGFGKRYILKANSSITGQWDKDTAVVDRAIALQKDEIARKKVEAKRVGIEYDSTTERLVYSEGDGPNGKAKYLDQSHPLAAQAISEYLTSHPTPGLPELKKLAIPYKAINFYESRNLSIGGTSAPNLKIIKDGTENFGENKQQNNNPFSGGLDSFTQSWSLMSGKLLKTFTLNGQVPEVSKEGVLPIVAPYSAVEQLLKLKPLPASASATARLERLREVREKAPSVEFGVCSRNSTSTDFINQALSTKREIEQNKGKKDYVKPSLIYDLPTEACGAAPIVRDVRTADEKVLAAKQLSFRRLFGEEVPEQAIIKFKVVGVSPDPPPYNAAFVDGLINAVLSSNIGANWFTTLEARSSNPLLAKLFPDQQVNGEPNGYFVELPTAVDAKAMLEKANCDPNTFSGATYHEGPSVQFVDFGSQFSECIKNGKYFFLNSYGSSSLALNDLQKGFAKVFQIAALVVIIIASIIMMGTLGRIIADARRETAVFRAIGAKRLDIAQIYIFYAVVISVLIGLCAILAGFGLSQIAQSKWGAQFTVRALVAYNARDLTRQFYLYAWSSRDVLYIVGAALAAGLISTIFPLARNLRRNPINDMRDEN